MLKKKAIWNIRSLSLALLVVGTGALTGCDDDDEADTPDPGVQYVSDLFANEADYSLLRAAVRRAGYADTLKRPTITVFAPTNAAFQAAGFADTTAISAAPQADIQNVLRYHIIGKRVEPSAFEQSGGSSEATLGGSPVFLSRRADAKVFVNAAEVLSSNSQAANGIVYQVNKVLMPPVGNLLQVAQANPNLSLLAAAVRRGGTAVVNALSSTGTPVTVFAPTNAAFQAAGYADTTAIGAADPQQLATILTYHVVSGRLFSPSLTNGDLTTLQGGTATVAVNGSSVTITGKGNNNTAATVTQADLTATNGVVHVIDRVLLPQ